MRRDGLPPREFFRPPVGRGSPPFLPPLFGAEPTAPPFPPPLFGGRGTDEADGTPGALLDGTTTGVEVLPELAVVPPLLSLLPRRSADTC